jgi:hypothetical protein
MSISVELDSDRSAVVLPKDCSIGSPRRVKNSELFISIKLFRTISACFHDFDVDDDDGTGIGCMYVKCLYDNRHV